MNAGGSRGCSATSGRAVGIRARGCRAGGAADGPRRGALRDHARANSRTLRCRPAATTRICSKSLPGFTLPAQRQRPIGRSLARRDVQRERHLAAIQLGPPRRLRRQPDLAAAPARLHAGARVHRDRQHHDQLLRRRDRPRGRRGGERRDQERHQRPARLAVRVSQQQRHQGQTVLPAARRAQAQADLQPDGRHDRRPDHRNKLFFFGSYEGTYDRQFASRLETVPTAAIKRGDMSASPTQMYDPATGAANGTGRTPFPNNQIPAARMDPIALRSRACCRTRPSTASRRTCSPQGAYKFNSQKMDGKINWNVSDKLTVFARGGVQDHDFESGPILGESGRRAVLQPRFGGGPDVRHHGQHGDRRDLRLSPRLILDGNFGYTAYDANSEELGLGKNIGLDTLGIPGTNGTRRFESGWPRFTVTNYATMGAQGNGTRPFYNRDPRYSVRRQRDLDARRALGPLRRRQLVPADQSHAGGVRRRTRTAPRAASRSPAVRRRCRAVRRRTSSTIGRRSSSACPPLSEGRCKFRTSTTCGRGCTASMSATSGRSIAS